MTMETTAMPDEQTYFMASLKAAPLLGKFQALHDPDSYPLTMPYGPNPMMADIDESPGAVLLDLSLPVSAKAVSLEADFRPVGLWVAAAEHQLPSGRVERLAAFLVRHADVHNISRLEGGLEAAVRRVLPPEDVTAAMFEDWIGRRIRSRRVEGYIAHCLARSSRAASAGSSAG